MFGFFLTLLKELGLQNRVEVRNGGGVPDLYNYLALLPLVTGFDGVTSLGVVCDCETDPATAFRDLCNSLRRWPAGSVCGPATDGAPSLAASPGRPPARRNNPRHAGNVAVAISAGESAPPLRRTIPDLRPPANRPTARP